MCSRKQRNKCASNPQFDKTKKLHIPSKFCVNLLSGIPQTQLTISVDCAVVAHKGPTERSAL